MVAPPTEIQNAIRVYYLGARARRASEMAPPPEPAQLEPSEPRAVEANETDVSASEARETDVSASEASDGNDDGHDARDEPERAWSETAEPVASAPAAARPRMITLTLLDGTTVRLPAPGGGAQTVEAEDSAQALTALDLVRALQARAKGEDVKHVLPDDRWELLFSTLLTLLIKKGLVADWEFVEEWERQRGD